MWKRALNEDARLYQGKDWAKYFRNSTHFKHFVKNPKSVHNIRRAYILRTREVHPDKNPNRQLNATEAFKQLGRYFNLATKHFAAGHPPPPNRANTPPPPPRQNARPPPPPPPPRPRRANPRPSGGLPQRYRTYNAMAMEGYIHFYPNQSVPTKPLKFKTDAVDKLDKMFERKIAKRLRIAYVATATVSGALQTVLARFPTLLAEIERPGELRAMVPSLWRDAASARQPWGPAAEWLIRRAMADVFARSLRDSKTMVDVRTIDILLRGTDPVDGQSSALWRMLSTM